jgi:hypothetical protein
MPVIPTLPPLNNPMLEKDGRPVSPWALWFLRMQSAIPGGGAAPADAEYIVATPDGGLPNARVGTTSTTIAWDYSVSGQAKVNLRDTTVTPGTYGDATHVSQVTFDAQGRATAASNVAITATGTVTHTGALTANELVVGNGGVDIKVVAATDGQVPIGKSSDGSVTLGTLTAGTGITITNAAASITIASTSTGGGTVIGLDRILGDGSTTAFNLADVAEYVTCVSDSGSVVDPSIYSLSSTRDQVVFGTAPTAGHVLTFQYVEATL